MNSLANILGDSIRQLVPLSLPDGTDNLRFYLSKAFLPVIKFGSVYPAPPPAGHKSHANSLSVKPSRLRTLKTMASIHRSDFADLVHQYCDEYIPNTRMEHVVGPRYPEASKAGDSKSRTVNTSGAKLTIPNPEYFSGIAGISGAPAKITDIHHIIHLVKNGPLETVREILGVLYPELKHWEFIHGSIDADRKIFRYMTYANTTTEQVTGLGTRGGPLVVIAQPSWILTPRDMKSMSQTVELKWVTTVEGGEPYHQSTGRVWAKIWDTCRLADARFFILTNWQCWVFGAFSEGWSRAWSVFLDSDSDPTVMQSVIFWVSSAMDLPGAWHTPQVPEAVDELLFKDTVSVPLPSTVKFPLPPQSESDFTVSSHRSNPISEAGSDRTIILARLSPQPEPMKDRPRLLDESVPRGHVRGLVRLWQEHGTKEETTYSSTPRLAIRYKSPSCGSDTSEDSVMETSFGKEVTDGQWLSGKPESPYV